MRPLLEPLLRALAVNDVRFVVVGGVAVVLQGYVRNTGDLDLILDLSPEEALKAMNVMTEFGLRPRAPVDPALFADASVRETWIEQKGMQVFTLHDPTSPLLEVDLFVENPIAFEELLSRSDEVDLGGFQVRVASITDLIELKRMSGRPKDLVDIDELKALRRLKDQ